MYQQIAPLFTFIFQTVMTPKQSAFVECNPGRLNAFKFIETFLDVKKKRKKKKKKYPKKKRKTASVLKQDSNKFLDVQNWLSICNTN